MSKSKEPHPRWDLTLESRLPAATLHKLHAVKNRINQIARKENPFSTSYVKTK